MTYSSFVVIKSLLSDIPLRIFSVLVELQFLQARKLLEMWRGAEGKKATPTNMVKALQKLPLTRAVIDKIHEECGL